MSDPVMIPCPMSLGCSGLIDSIVLFKENAFLGTSAHESVLPVGYLLDCRCASRPRQTLAGSSEMVLGRAGANLGQHNGAIWSKNVEDEPILTKNTSEWHNFSGKYIRMVRL